MTVLAVTLLVPGFVLSLLLPTTAAPALPDVEPHVDAATHKSYTETIPGSKVQFDMVAIPGGVFLRGSPGVEKDAGSDETPRHPVRVRPFWMGAREVTWDEYNLYRVKNGRYVTQREEDEDRKKNADAITRPSAPYGDEYRGFGNEGFPAIGMSHHAAMEYCRWLSQQTGKAYRLPTEAEWEWASRAGASTLWFFGDQPDRLGEYARYAKNSEESIWPVGSRKPNPWGLYDIYGNAAEWCLDSYQADYYRLFPTDQLVVGPVNMPGTNRFPHVVRGGSWEDPASKCRSAARLASDKKWNRQDPDRPQSLWWLWDIDTVGFRIVCAVEEQENLKGIRSRVTKTSP